MAGNAYQRGEHLRLVQGYLQNIERLAANAKTLEDWQFVSVDLLDNCRAALTLVSCMV